MTAPPAEMAAFLAHMPEETRRELATSLAEIDAKVAKRAALEQRRAKAAAAAAEIEAAANARELAAEPDVDAPCEGRLERLLSGEKPELPRHVQREQIRKRNADREFTRRQLQMDSQALAELAMKLAREIEDLDRAIAFKRQAFLRSLIGPLVAVARESLISHVRGCVQIATGVRAALLSMGVGSPVTLDDVARIDISFWRPDGTNTRDRLWPPDADSRGNVRYAAALGAFDPPAALAALEAALRADAAPAADG